MVTSPFGGLVLWCLKGSWETQAAERKAFAGCSYDQRSAGFSRWKERASHAKGSHVKANPLFPGKGEKFMS